MVDKHASASHYVAMRIRNVLSLLVVAGLVAAACGSSSTEATEDAGGAITVYSGRSEDLIAPIFQAFEDETGIEINVKYDDSANLALLIETEGDATPADVFVSQSPGAVGFLDGKGLLQELPANITDRVDPLYRSVDGTWVGATARARTLVYNPTLISEDELPMGVLEIQEPQWAGRVGVAPSNGSFQDFVTAFRFQEGDDVVSDWLTALADGGAPTYAKNSAIVDAVARGEIELGLVNHYYVLETLAEDPDAPVANHFFPATDVGSLVIVTGTAILGQSDNVANAQKLLEFFLSDEAQVMFSAGEGEYPLVEGIPIPEGLPPLSGLGYTVDLSELGGGLEATAEIIRDSGLQG